jgi:hypothetical protein
MARTLGRDQDDVDVARRRDRVVANVEAVREDDRVLRLQRGRDLLGPDLRLRRVGREDDDDVGPLRHLPRPLDDESGRFRLGAALGLLVQADAHVDAGVAQVHRVRVPLRAVADDGDLLLLDEIEVRVFVVEDVSHVEVPRFPG